MVRFTGLLAMLPWSGTPLGPDFRYTKFSGGRGFRILPTHTFGVAGVFEFYLHTLFGRPGFLHFTYTHFSGGRGFAFLPTHTGDS